MTKTEWISGDLKPVRVGVYERKYLEDIRYCNWTGEFWCTGAYGVHFAANHCIDRSFRQDALWRGLTEESK